MKKITDKMRLDWLQKNKVSFSFVECSGWWLPNYNGFIYSTIRKAIDAAIRKTTERKPERKR